MIPRHLFDGTNVVRSSFLEVLDVQLFNILGQGQFPGFLLRAGQAVELLRIKPQLSGHLDVGMGKMVALPRIDPSFSWQAPEADVPQGVIMMKVRMLVGLCFVICGG
jgi:hypothetical protein